MKARIKIYALMALTILFGAGIFNLAPVKASLWQMYKELGEPLPSISERAELAAELGIFGYKGTAEQNIELEKRARPLFGLDEFLGFSVISRYKTTLSSSMTSSQTTVPAASMSTFDGTTITMALLGGTEVFLTLEPGSSREEIVRCTAISGTTWTGCTRGLAFSGSSKSAVAANQKTHNAGSVVVMSNVHYVYENFIDAIDAETIYGIKTFMQRPVIDAGGGVASSSQQIVTFNELQNMANQGAATSTEAISGISEQATQLEMASSTPFDADNPHFMSSEYATSTPYGHSNIGNFAVIGNHNGYIDQEWLNKAEAFAWTNSHSWSASTTFQATSTHNNLDINGHIEVNNTISDAVFNGSSSNADALHTHNFGMDSVNFNYTIPTNVNFWSSPEGAPAYDNVWVRLNGANGEDIKSELFPDGTDISAQFDDTKDISFQTRARFATVASGDSAGFGFSKTGAEFRSSNGSVAESVSFFVTSTASTDQLYALTGNGTASTTVFIPGITLSNWNTYKVVFDRGVSAKFYVNGTLQATITTTLPGTANSMYWWARIDQLAEDVYLGPVQISKEL